MASLPTITVINPSTGPVFGGTPILITGTNLSGATVVTFGTGAGAATATPTSTTATSVSVVTPAHASGLVRVSVVTPAGSSTQPALFNYVTIAIPVLTSLSPTHGPAAGGNVTTITGSSLRYTTGVTFTQGTTTVPASSFAILSDTQIVAVVPPASSGPGPATVAAANGAGPSISSQTYTYDAAIGLPVVTAVSPTHGPAAGGNTVVLTGTGFTYATQVKFGTVNSASFSISSDTSIIAIAPPGPSSGGAVTVLVTGPGGAGTSGATYTYDAFPTPSLTSLTPTSGPLAGGNTVTITGTNLNTVTAVSFNGVPASLFTILSPTAINAVVPAGTTATGVPVTVSAGTFTSGSLTYTYIAAPAATSIFPTAGIISGGTPITIVGSGLTGTTNILFGSSPAPPDSITVVDDTQVDALTPPHPIGTVPVTITTPGGTDTTLTFSFQPPPVITSISPASGPTAGGTTVTINGAGLIYVTDVFFGSVSATSHTVISDNQITAVSPAGTGAVAVTASTPAAFSNGALFQYVAAPTLTSISPTTGYVLGGNNVTLTGTGFTTTQNVFFGSLPTSYTVLSDTSITATAPAVGSAGPVNVTVQNGGGTSAPQTYTYHT